MVFEKVMPRAPLIARKRVGNYPFESSFFDANN